MIQVILVPAMNQKNPSGFTQVWLYHAPSKIQLTISDRNVITCGYQINDKHINFALGILKAQFSSIEGLKLTILQSHFKFDSSKYIVLLQYMYRPIIGLPFPNLKCYYSKSS